MNRIVLTLLTIATAAAAPAVASASSVGIDPGSGFTVFRSGATAADASTVGSFTFLDAAESLRAGPGCAAGPSGVTCPPTSVQQFLLGGGDDRLRALSRQASEVLVEGGPGADDVSVDANAGASVHGGAGGDTVRLNADGRTDASGGAGADHLRGGGASTLLHGGDGADLLASGTGASQPNLLFGDAGDDQLVVDLGRTTADGGSGADAIVVFDNPTIGSTQLSGGAGGDTISSPTRPTTVGAGPGADIIDLFGEHADTVECGPGGDVVYADALDVVAADCEQVRHTPAPALAAVEAARAHYAETFGAG